MTAEPGTVGTHLPEEPSSLRNFWVSSSALVTKEARWRMRGRRAFVIITVYVGLLALLVFGVQQMYERVATAAAVDSGEPSGMVAGAISAVIGQSIFSAILVVQTLLTLLVAPALTSSSISIEREKQTLELLITTPASTLGMVVGKLLSSLAYVFLLVVASVPLMSIVFAFGGIAPDDVLRAYLLLFTVAFGVGSVGLFLSALIKRTQIATAVSYLLVFLVVIGAFILHTYLLAISTGPADGVRRTPPEALLLLNPLVADVDLACTAIPESYIVTCQYISTVTGQEFDPASPPRDAYWPRSAAAFFALGVGLTLASTQLIAPSRRLRRQRPPSDRAGQETESTLSTPGHDEPAVDVM